MSEHFNKKIKKWLDGDFRRSDEDALRQSAKDDAFVRDAMDGFYNLPEEDHAARLASLRKKIRGNVDVPMQAEKSKPKWWVMAAALAFLLGAVWFMQSKNFGEKNVMSDVVEKTEPIPEMASEPELKVEPHKEAQKVIELKPSDPTEKPKQSTAIPNKKSKRKKLSKPAPPQISQAPIPVVSASESVVTTPKPTSTIEPTTITHETEDAYGMLEATDAIVVEEVTAEKTDPTVAAKDQIQTEAKVKKRATSKEEAVAEAETSFDTDRELAPFADSVYNAGAYANAMPPEPIPARGWDDFRRYLRINARLTEEAMNNNVSGTVRVRFGINQMGEPINIVVIKSLGYGCDEEAKRLIEEGGEWQLGVKATVTVDVKFTR